MPLELQIIRANEFVRIGPQNLLDLEESKKALELLALACRKRGINEALLDLREIPIPEQPLFTPGELAALVESFRNAGFTDKQRLAILYRKDPHHGVRMFAFISTLRGFHVRAFEDFESAVLWLSGQGDHPEVGAQEVPLKKISPGLEVKRGKAFEKKTR